MFILWRRGLGVLLLAALVVVPVVTVNAAPAVDLSIGDVSTQTQSGPSTSMSTIGPGFESSVAVNPTNPSNIMVTGTGGIFDGDNFGLASVSSDGGQTWRFGNASLPDINAAIPSDGWGFIDPVGTFDASGNAYVATVDNGTMDWLFKSTDGGNSFLLTSPFVRMDDDLLDYNSGSMVHPCNEPPGPYRDYPAVIADPYPASPYRDNVYVLVRTAARFSSTSCPFGLAYERSTDGGRTWGSGIWLGPSDIPPYSPFPSDYALSGNRGMAVAPDGTVLLAGIAYCGALGEVTLLKSIDGGASFQKICVNAPNFGPDQVEVVATTARSIYIVFFGSNGTVAEHLYSEVSHDGGITWSLIDRIDDVTAPDSTHVAHTIGGALPMWGLSVSRETGRLNVAWLDWRNNGGNYALADLYYSYSMDGLSWATNIRATPQGPYFTCADRGCSGTGNDFMWVASSDEPGIDRAYIVAALGKAGCVYSCSPLLTRFVTITFPSASLGVSVFYTDPSLSPLLVDGGGNSMVNLSLAKGIAKSTSPRQILAWVNVTNTDSTTLDSLKLNETLPVDWNVSPAWMPARGAIHVYYDNTTSLSTNLEITPSSTITVSNGNPEKIHISIPDFNTTAVGHPLMPGQSILVGVKLSYGLLATSQSAASYPRIYTYTAGVSAWTQQSYAGTETSSTNTASLTVYTRILTIRAFPMSRTTWRE